MIDFVLNIRSELVWDLDGFRKYFMLWELRPSRRRGRVKTSVLVFLEKRETVKRKVKQS